jgi:hypothetical protein
VILIQEVEEEEEDGKDDVGEDQNQEATDVEGGNLNKKSRYNALPVITARDHCAT